MQKLLTLSTILVLCSLFTARGQNSYTLKGIITDSLGTPLAGASIAQENGILLATSNELGAFSFTTSLSSLQLNFNYLGYEPQQIQVKQPYPASIEVVLKGRSQQLQAVSINTGYQQLSPGRMTGSAEVLDEKQINRATGLNILERLEGISPTVLFDKRGQSPNLSGTNNQLLIRGLGSLLASSQPLIILDNFPFEGDINSINPQDIQNITILKDAAAAAIWGARAGNGVIVITTRNAHYNQKIKVGFNQSYQNTAKPNLNRVRQLSPASYLEAERFLFERGFYNTLENSLRRPALSPAIELLIARRAGNINEQQLQEALAGLASHDVREDFDRYIYQEATNQQYALDISAGGKHQHFRIGAGYDTFNQHLRSNEGSRITFNIAQTFKPIKPLQIATTIAYAATKAERNASRSLLGYGQIRQGTRNLYPYARFADEEGNPLRIDKDFRSSVTDALRASNPFLLDWDYRPLQELALADNSSSQSNLRIASTAQYRINAFLNAELRYQYQQEQENSEDYYSQDSYYTRNLINLFSQNNAGNITRNIPLGGINDKGFSRLNSHSLRFQINGEKEIAPGHSLQALAGAERRSTSTSSNSYRLFGYDKSTLSHLPVNLNTIFPAFNNLAIANSIPDNVANNAGVNNFISYYGQLAYDYQKRYQLSLTGRKDASNLFGVETNQKGTPLWSAGVAWNIHEETFFPTTVISLLKLRSSYGYAGNVDNSRSAQTVLSFSLANSNINNLPFANIQNPPNPNLRWERVGTTNLGLDFATKENRISGSFDIYWKRTKDLLAFEPVDPTTGFTFNTINNATTSGKGWELQLNSINIPGTWKWASQLMIAYNQTTVTSYESNFVASSYVNTGGTVAPLEGYPVYALFSYRNAGLDPQTGEPQGFLNGVVSKNYAGIASGTALEDLVFHGSAIPLYNGILRNSISYKAIELSFSLSFRLNYYFRRSTINYSNLATGNSHADYDLRWRQPGDEAFTQIPAFIYPLNSQRDSFYGNTDAVVDRGDHVRLQDIRLNYSPKLKWKWLPAQTNLFVWANNLGMVWRANAYGIDPDYGVDAIPPSATLAFGIRSTF